MCKNEAGAIEKKICYHKENMKKSRNRSRRICMKKMIDVKHLTKTYGTRFNQTKVLDNLSFSVDQG